MAVSQTDLDALDAAIARGVLEVSYGDRRVKYHSINDMIKARDHVASILAAPATAATTVSYAAYIRD